MIMSSSVSSSLLFDALFARGMGVGGDGEGFGGFRVVRLVVTEGRALRLLELAHVQLEEVACMLRLDACVTLLLPLVHKALLLELQRTYRFLEGLDLALARMHTLLRLGELAR